MPRETGSTEPQPSRGTSGPSQRTPTLASALTRGWRRQIGHRLDEARYHVGIDLGTTNSSVAIVDALALLDGDTYAAVYGPFTSYFKDKPVPAASDTGAAAPPALGEPQLDASPESRIVVVGDGEFFVDDKGRNDRDNLLFFQNLVDWLAQDEDLIGIRSREVTDRPLKAVSDPTKRFLKYANMLGSPLVVVALGIVAWQLRRRRRVEL